MFPKFLPIFGFLPLILLSSCGFFSVRTEALKGTSPGKGEAEPDPPPVAQIRISEAELRASMVDSAVEAYIDSLSDEDRISQLFLVNVEGSEKFAPVERKNDGTPLVPGGCLLFSFNIADSPEKIAAFTRSISEFCAENSLPPPYVAVDQEGGDVNRLRGITSVLWSQRKVGERFSAESAKMLYASQARQMKMLGIDMNLAPVVEVESPENSEFLGTRTFGNLERTLRYAASEIGGFEENSVATVLKHFPGNSAVDPHSGLPKIDLGGVPEESYVSSFASLLPLSSGVLMSHAVVSGGGSGDSVPACLSERWVSGVIREKLFFSGLVISDDIFMGALSKNGWPPEKAAVAAVEAGVNVIMLSEKRFGEVARILLDESARNPDFAGKIRSSVKKIVEFKLKYGILETVEEGEAKLSVRAANREKFDIESFLTEKKAGMRLYE